MTLRHISNVPYSSLTQAQLDMDAGLPFLGDDGKTYTKKDLRKLRIKKVTIAMTPEGRSRRVGTVVV